jgi:hypothetical protein
MPISDLEFQMLYDSGPLAMRTVFRQLEQRTDIWSRLLPHCLLRRIKTVIIAANRRRLMG